MRALRIAMIGQKGVPATHGGVERHVEELGARLVALGHEVTVFTRPNYTDPNLREYRGMRLRSLPTIGTKHLDAIFHSALSTCAVLFGGYDIAHYHAIGPCLTSPLARLGGKCVVATIHGQDWRRDKWGQVAGSMLRLAEAVALRVPAATIVVSRSLAETYRQAGHRVDYIPNGISVEAEEDVSVLEEFGLETGNYILFAGRLVPEKGAHYLVNAYQSIDTDQLLVIAGDSSMSDAYAEELREDAADGVVFTGYQYGPRLAALFKHASLFVLPSDLEGLPIVLLEALAYGVPVLASDIPPNAEVLGDRGTYFSAGDVADLTRTLGECIERRSEMFRVSHELRETAVAEYDWDVIADATVALYQKACKRDGAR